MPIDHHGENNPRASTCMIMAHERLYLIIFNFILFFKQEKGQKAERFGRAVLGILLLQDIAVVPLLVLLPIIETQGGANAGLSEQLMLVGATVAKGVGGLGGILVAGRFLLRPLFDVVAGGQKSKREGTGRRLG